LAAGAVAAGPAPEADAALGDCQSTAGCIWVDNSYKGRKGQWLGCIDKFPSGLDDAASSVYNRGTSGQKIYLYTGKDATGSGPLKLDKNHGTRMLSDYGWDNVITSAYFEGMLGKAGTASC
jgi:hypothetical protein